MGGDGHEVYIYPELQWKGELVKAGLASVNQVLGSVSLKQGQGLKHVSSQL